MSNRRLQRPLDPDAVKAANEKLWKQYPELEGRKLTMAPEDYKYRKYWVDQYLAAKGKVEEPKPAAPPKRPAEKCDACRKLTAKLISVTFTSDHGLLTDKTDDWKKGGQLFEAKDKREWTEDHSFPISHSRKKKIALTVEFEIGPAGAAPDSGTVTGDGGDDALTFRGAIQLAPGRVSASLTADKELPDRVAALKNKNIRWTVEGSRATAVAGTSGKHTIYVTLDTPKNEGKQEDGVTLKRMDKAVELVAGARSTDPHKIVAHLMAKFEFYTLERDPAVPAKYKHPTYFNHAGGAWPMADFIPQTGECQAIVRFVRGVIKQVGCPGEAVTVVVWSDPNVDGGRKALESEWGKGGGLSGVKKVVDGETWYAALADRNPIRNGQTFRPKQIGLNNFEACLRFEHNGVKKYYGGGAGVYDSPQEVLSAFYALVWVTFDVNAAGNDIITIREIVRRYR